MIQNTQILCPTRPIWTLTADFLVEPLPGNEIRLWGRWDSAFGCWDGNGHSLRPTGRIFGRLGSWPDPEGEHDDEWYEARAVLAAYWSMVPSTVRLMASHLEEGQWEFLISEWNKRRPACL